MDMPTPDATVLSRRGQIVARLVEELGPEAVISTEEELRAIIHVIGIYCGVPQALECFRAAKKVMNETPAE